MVPDEEQPVPSVPIGLLHIQGPDPTSMPLPSGSKLAVVLLGSAFIHVPGTLLTPTYPSQTLPEQVDQYWPGSIVTDVRVESVKGPTALTFTSNCSGPSTVTPVTGARTPPWNAPVAWSVRNVNLTSHGVTRRRLA